MGKQEKDDTFYSSVVNPLVRDFRNAVQQVAEMFRGGLAIHSTRENEQQQEIYAQTVIQLDGDVVTAYSTEVIESRDFETLADQHMVEVGAALKPLEKLANHFGRVRRFLICIGAIGGLISIISSTHIEKFWYFLGFSGSTLIGVAGLLLRKVLFKIAEHQVKRLSEVAKREAEAYAREILAKQ